MVRLFEDVVEAREEGEEEDVEQDQVAPQHGDNGLSCEELCRQGQDLSHFLEERGRLGVLRDVVRVAGDLPELLRFPVEKNG